MKALFYDPHKQDIFIEETPVPALQPNDVLLKMDMCGICGSDVVAWKGGFKRITEPVILGHEGVGYIADLNGLDNTGFKLGERVVLEPLDTCGQCDACKKGHYNVCEHFKIHGIDKPGLFAEYVAARADRIHKIDDSVSVERCATCEPVSVGVHMVRRADVSYGDTVVISGAGPIGLLVGIISLRAGASKVIITDMNEYKLNLARELGMIPVNIKDEDFIEQIFAHLNGKYADVAFELVGVADALNTCLKVAKCRGTLLTAGMFKSIPSVEMGQAIFKEVNIVGSRVYTYDDYEKAIHLLEDPTFPIEKLISAVVPFEDVKEQGFRPLREGKDLVKVLVKI